MLKKTTLLFMGCFVATMCYAIPQDAINFTIADHLSPQNDNTGAAAIMYMPPTCRQISGKTSGFIASGETVKFKCSELPKDEAFQLNTGADYFPYFNQYACFMNRPNDAAVLKDNHCEVKHKRQS